MKTVRFLFSDDMARAIVEGRKTVTRRPIVPQPEEEYVDQIAGDTIRMLRRRGSWATVSYVAKAFASPGDLLIGRECWAAIRDESEEWNESTPHGGRVEYRADHDPPLRKPGGWDDAEPGDAEMVHWRPSIHMPDWAARIRRRVVSITVERLQDISEADAVREGFGPSEELEELFRNCAPPGSRMQTARERFADTWDRIYAPKNLGWAANPWVWRIEFSAENVPPA